MDDNKKIKRRVRSAYFISTVSIALVLFLLGSVGYLILNAIRATDRLKESVALYIMLDDGAAEQHPQIKAKLEQHTQVKSVRFVSKDEAASEFKADVGDNFEDFLKDNPLPDSYEIRLNANSSQDETVKAIEQEILTWEGVDEVVFQRNVLSQISSNINKFNLVLLLFGGTLLIISLILLNNTIRVTIFAKRHIINTMKLVGATGGFILRPFLVNSLLQGLYAGLIASAMLLAMMFGLSEGIPEVNFSSGQIDLIIIFGALLLGGMVISFLFTTFAVRKFLRMNSRSISIY